MTEALEPPLSFSAAANRSRLLLGTSALIFGSMFVPTERAVEDLTPAGSVAVRFLVATVAVVPLLFIRAVDPGADERPPARARDYALAGLLAGGVNAFNFLVQGLALQRTSTSSVAFLSSLFVVFVPALAALLSRRFPPRSVLLGVGLAVVGSFLLSGGALSMRSGDVLALTCAIGGSVHIMVIGAFASKLRAPLFNLVQLGVVAVVATVVGLVSGFGTFTWVAVLCMVYCGATLAIALSLQVVAQRRVDPASSALILLLIPVVGAASAVVLLGDEVTVGRVAGSLLIIAAVVVAEVLPARRAAGLAAPEPPSDPPPDRPFAESRFP